MEKTVKIGFQVGRWNDAVWVLFLTFLKKKIQGYHLQLYQKFNQMMKSLAKNYLKTILYRIFKTGNPQVPAPNKTRNPGTPTRH